MMQEVLEGEGKQLGEGAAHRAGQGGAGQGRAGQGRAGQEQGKAYQLQTAKLA